MIPIERYKIKAGQGQWFVIYDHGTVVHESGLSDIKKYLKKNSSYSDKKIQDILDKSLSEFVPIDIRLTNESIKLRNILFEGQKPISMNNTILVHEKIKGFVAPWYVESLYFVSDKNKHKILAQSTFEDNKVARDSFADNLPELSNKKVAYIDNLYSKMKGAGTILMQKLIDKAKKEKYDYLILNCRIDNHKAIHLYMKFGFKQIDDTECYYLRIK